MVETENSMIFEWQMDVWKKEWYFEIEKHKDSGTFEIMLEQDGKIEHWELKKV